MMVLLLMGAAWVSTSTVEAAKLRRVAVDGDRVTLGDVLRKAPVEVASLELGASPEPGKSKVVHGKLIRRRLREALISARGLRIPKKVRVIRRAQVLTELQLQELVERQLPRYLPGAVAEAPEVAEPKSGGAPLADHDVVRDILHERLVLQVSLFPVLYYLCCDIFHFL